MKWPWTKTLQEASGFETILKKELLLIQEARRLRRGIPPPDPPKTQQESPGQHSSSKDNIERGDSYREAHEAGLIGLALSGGGIRSATFNLGVLQGLAHFGLLSKFDYLSTVSGGGYIGSWLTAWIQRTKSLRRVEDALKPQRVGDAGKEETREIRFLRDYSNYLTPRKGLLAADTWTLVMTYLRNSFLNLIILVLALVAILISPRIVVWLYKQSASSAGEKWLLWSLFLLALALTTLVMNLSSLFEERNEQPRQPRYAEVWWIRVLVVFPIVLAAWLLSGWLWALTARPSGLGDWWLWALLSGLVYFLIWVVGWVVGQILKSDEKRGTSPSRPIRSTGGKRLISSVKELYLISAEVIQDTRGRTTKVVRKAVSTMNFWLVAIASFLSGMLGGTLLLLIARWFTRIRNGNDPGAEWHAASWGMPLVVLVFMLTAVIHVGLVGRGFTEEAREWWSRLGAYVFLWTGLVAAWFGLAIYAPVGVSFLVREVGDWSQWGLVLGWALTTGAGIWVGKSPTSGTREAKPLLEIVARVAPFVFVVGLLVALSSLIQNQLPSLLNAAVTGDSYWSQMDATLKGWLVLLVAGFLLIALLLSYQVGINAFSMHALYRNRLVRCYLGAANPMRKPHPFTGFDPSDDVSLSDSSPDAKNKKGSAYVGPYPIINTALNLVGGAKLAWQQRKAASFVFTPQYCGYEVDRESAKKKKRNLSDKGYRPTEGYAEPVTLGTAMAISGAAASPNMGYHSSAPLAFLMTIFNVRLGWWLGNPRHHETWDRPGPGFGLFYLLVELLGRTNDERRYVYLSDGGHFENLGIYELVRRRCRLIVACDATEDREARFGDLGNAIEKCRADFGIPIEINIEPLRPKSDGGFSQWHCAVGTIHYQKADKECPTGTLLYIKASLTGDEPADVKRYAAYHPEFPHQTTADQWFDESQFESYRMLGYHIVQSAFDPIWESDVAGTTDTERLLVALRQRWYPPSSATEAAFTKHTATLDRIFQQVRTNGHLKFLDAQLYPEWQALMAGRPGVPQAQLWLPNSYEARRAGFYICNQMLQLMENVYLDLNLEEEYDHPDNRGWMNLFQHWSWSGMFQASWAVSASTYGARFQTWCRRHLDLDVGDRVSIGDPLICNRKVLKDAEAKGVLNFLEVQLLESFIANNGITQSDRIFPLQIIVQDPMRKGKPIIFTFGFAVVRLEEPTPKERHGVIRYFRVQDHLRTMGLARKALIVLIGDERSQARQVRLGKMPVDAPEVPTERDKLKFMWMFNSVLREMNAGS